MYDHCTLFKDTWMGVWERGQQESGDRGTKLHWKFFGKAGVDKGTGTGNVRAMTCMWKEVRH